MANQDEVTLTTPNTLEEYLHFYSFFGYSEEDTVELYIKEKGLEIQYSNMLMRLMQNALYKEQYRNSKAKEVIQCYNNCCGAIHNSEWTQEQNTLWDKWLIEYALNFKLSDDTKKQVQKLVPNMTMPRFGFRGLLSYINKECNVLFKDQTEADDFDLLEVPKVNFMTRW